MCVFIILKQTFFFNSVFEDCFPSFLSPNLLSSASSFVCQPVTSLLIARPIYRTIYSLPPLEISYKHPHFSWRISKTEILPRHLLFFFFTHLSKYQLHVLTLSLESPITHFFLPQHFISIIKLYIFYLSMYVISTFVSEVSHL